MTGTVAVLSATTSGSIAGASLGAVGALISPSARAAVGVACCLMLLTATVARREVVQINRETDQALLELGPTGWAVANGALLGLGFTSRIGFWLWWVLPLASVVLGSPRESSLVWGAYALCRTGVSFGLAMIMRREPSKTTNLTLRLLGSRPRARRLTNALLVPLLVLLIIRLGL